MGSLHLGEEKCERLIKSMCPFVSHTHRTGGLLSGIGRLATPQLSLPSADTFNRLLRRRAGRLCSHIKAPKDVRAWMDPRCPLHCGMLLGHRLLCDYFCRPGILTWSLTEKAMMRGHSHSSEEPGLSLISRVFFKQCKTPWALLCCELQPPGVERQEEGHSE